MADNAASDTKFSHELAKALTRSGISLLTQPERLLTVLDEAIQDDPALRTLKQNCTAELLTPFYDLLNRNQDPSESELKEATRDAEVYLVQERYIEQSDASLLCTQLAEGISLYLHPNVEPTPEPDDNSDSDANTYSYANTDSETSAVPPDPQPWRKHLPLIAAALALLVVGIALSMRITISFDGNGSTSGSMPSVRVWKDKEWTVPSCRFERSGYAFMGWRLNDKTYLPNDTLTVSQECTLRALWGATISFKANGGSGSMNDLPADEIGYLKLPACEYSRPDYEFVGWSSEERSWSDNPTTLDPGEGIVADGPSTYYAIWAPLASFDSNGASGSMDKMRISPDGKVTLPKNEFTRSGYRFIGWSKTRDGKLAGPGKTVTADGPTTFYAVWRPLATFDSNGGSGTMNDVAAKKGGVLTLPENKFTRSNYRFIGWATTSSGTPKKPGETVTISEPTTFYARWGAEVSFDANGGSGHTSSVYADANNMATLPSNSFSRPEHTFVGWMTSPTATSHYKAGNRIEATKPTTFYALWQLNSNITDKISDSLTLEYWGEDSVALYYLTNNSSTSLRFEGTFTYLSSGSQVDEEEFIRQCVAPGETIFIPSFSSKSGIDYVRTSYTVSDPREGQKPLGNSIRVEETTVKNGEITLRLTNVGSSKAYIRGVFAYGTNAQGGQHYWTTYPDEYIDAGDSTVVSMYPTADWSIYSTRNYYLDGHML